MKKNDDIMYIHIVQKTVQLDAKKEVNVNTGILSMLTGTLQTTIIYRMWTAVCNRWNLEVEFPSLHVPSTG